MINNDLLRDSFKIILHDKNVLHFRSNEEILKLVDIYTLDNNIHVLDIITNKNVLEYRNNDEQLMLIKIYKKNPCYEIKKIITNFEFLNKCTFDDQISAIKKYLLCQNFKSNEKEETKKKKRLFMWRARHN